MRPSIPLPERKDEKGKVIHPSRKTARARDMANLQLEEGEEINDDDDELVDGDEDDLVVRVIHAKGPRVTRACGAPGACAGEQPPPGRCFSAQSIPRHCKSPPGPVDPAHGRFRSYL